MKQKTSYQNHLDFRVIFEGNIFWVIFALGNFCSECFVSPPMLPLKQDRESMLPPLLPRADPTSGCSDFRE